MIRPKKSLGQNFLKSQGVVRVIVATARLEQSDIVVEIGPGKGVLTKQLLESIDPKKGGRVIAIEKDNRLIEILNNKFVDEIESGGLVVVHDDVLKIDLANLRKEYNFSKYVVVANIPYYITGEFLEKFLSSDHHPSKMVLLLQKEVVDRIMARDEKESILSASVKAYGTPLYIKKVNAESFSPKPKVDSAILLIDDISKDFFGSMNEKEFFRIVKAGFAHKRKVLVNNLREVAEKEKISKAFEYCGINEKIRAENLTLASWKCLFHLLK